jgi:protein TonB
MNPRLNLLPLDDPPDRPPSPIEPPTMAWGTAPAPPPWRGFAIALLAHGLLFGAVFGFFRLHRLTPPPSPPVIALVMQKAPAPVPPAPAAVKKPPTPALPPPPPVPPSPAKVAHAKPPPPAAHRTIVARASVRAPATPHLAQTATRATGPTIPARPDRASGNPQPVYPELSRERGEQGWVLLTVHVEPDGTPDAATVTESSGYPRLDDSARDRVLRYWHFDPALKAGQPVASTIDLWFSFQLKN